MAKQIINLVDRCYINVNDNSNYQDFLKSLLEIKRLCTYAHENTDLRNQRITQLFPLCTLQHEAILLTLRLYDKKHGHLSQNLVYIQMVASILQYQGLIRDWRYKIIENDETYVVKCENGLFVTTCSMVILPCAWYTYYSRLFETESLKSPTVRCSKHQTRTK